VLARTTHPRSQVWFGSNRGLRVVWWAAFPKSAVRPRRRAPRTRQDRQDQGV